MTERQSIDRVNTTIRWRGENVTDVLLCVGNSMMGDDGAGPLLAEMCAATPPGNWQVIDGGSAPENDIVAIRELRPDMLLIVDATDMGLNRRDSYCRSGRYCRDVPDDHP